MERGSFNSLCILMSGGYHDRESSSIRNWIPKSDWKAFPQRRGEMRIWRLLVESFRHRQLEVVVIQLGIFEGKEVSLE